MTLQIQDIYTNKDSYIFGVDKNIDFSFSLYDSEEQKNINKITLIYGIEILYDQKIIASKKNESVIINTPNTLYVGIPYNCNVTIPILYPNHIGKFVIRNFISVVCDISGTWNDVSFEYYPEVSRGQLYLVQDNVKKSAQHHDNFDMSQLPDIRIIHNPEKFQSVQNEIDTILGNNDITETEQIILNELYEEQKKYYTIDLEQQKKNEDRIKEHFDQLMKDSEMLLKSSRLLLKSTNFSAIIFSYKIGSMIGIMISVIGLILVDKNIYIANIFLWSGVLMFIMLYTFRKINQNLNVKFRSKSYIKKSLLKGPILPRDIFCKISKSWKFRDSSHEYNFSIVFKNVLYIIEKQGKSTEYKHMTVNTIEIGKFQGKDPSLENIVWNKNLEVISSNIFPIYSLNSKLNFAFFGSTYILSTGYIIEIENHQDATQAKISLEFKPSLF